MNSKERNEDEIGEFFKKKFSHHENDVGELIKQINQQFYEQEYVLIDMMEQVEKDKEKFLGTLTQIENNYEEFLKINEKVFDKINEAKSLVSDYKDTEDAFNSYIQNLKNLQSEITKERITNN